VGSGVEPAKGARCLLRPVLGGVDLGERELAGQVRAAHRRCLR
jgi:hypothetical protein